jgi:hypothetical protein
MVLSLPQDCTDVGGWEHKGIEDRHKHLPTMIEGIIFINIFHLARRRIVSVILQRASCEGRSSSPGGNATAEPTLTRRINVDNIIPLYALHGGALL